jgi:transcriptional regulator with XRE-family HTH domain
MLLEHYLHNKKLKIAQFAQHIGATEMAVRNYLAGKRIPSLQMMLRIYDVTNGKVTANDFYNYPGTKVNGAKNHGKISTRSDAKSGQ